MPKKLNTLRIIPLGGIDEIGKNMTVLEYGDDMLVIDCGVMFPSDDLPGIDLVIPDDTYLVKNADKLRGYVITHGHEDHIGGLPYIIQHVNAPVYGTRLTLALVEHRLKEQRISNVQLNVVRARDRIKLGIFEIEFIKVNHSIAGAVALAITTPVGVIVHSGDFKIDYTPIDGDVADLGRLAEIGNHGVLALMCDSTNVEREGYTMSERTVGDAFERLFIEGEGKRIIVATFSSNIHRIQQIIDRSVKFGRKVCFCGRSMINVANLAMDIGEMIVPDRTRIDVEDIDDYPKGKVTVITTGSQGEPMSGLSRMASNEHKLHIGMGDMVIISATPIPGNEKMVSRVINNLFRNGAIVIYESLADVHVSGHACKEELKLMHRLVKPHFFIPVHGEYRHLKQHAMLAESLGIPKENIMLPELGAVIEITKHEIKQAGSVPSGVVLIDGLGIGDVGNIVLRDRKHLSQDGLFVVVVTLSGETGELLAGPDILSRGFVYVRESEELIDEAKALVRSMVERSERSRGDWASIKNNIRAELKEFLYQKTKRSPMILPIIVEI